jgi:hypothetical protein
MTRLTHQDVAAALGPADEHLIAEVLASGATAEELADACAWMANDEAPMNAGRTLPGGRLGRLIELLEAAEDSMPEIWRE